MWRFPIHPSIHPSIHQRCMYGDTWTGWVDVWFGVVCSPPITVSLCWGGVVRFYINNNDYYSTSDLPAVGAATFIVTAPPRGQQ